jgi:RNA polymerase sigma-70 factor, ECF subfamily
MQAFQELYERYYPDVYRFALFLTGDHARAEDLAADTFVRAWIVRERITAATVRAYLFTIAKNLHRDARRRERPVAELADPVIDPRPAVDV